MAANPEQSEAIGIEALRALEASVLKALCLTINTAGSELKYKILDSLSEDDFYFPLNQAVFQTLAELHRRGEYVISANLDEELQKTGEDIPANTIEELFSGTIPGLSDLTGWVVRMKERSRVGMVPRVEPPKSEPAVDPLEEKVDMTQVRSVKDVKKKIAVERLRKSSPALDPPEVSSPDTADIPDIEDIEIPFDTSELEMSSPAVAAPSAEQGQEESEERRKGDQGSREVVARRGRAEEGEEGDQGGPLLRRRRLGRLHGRSCLEPGKDVRHWFHTAR